MTNLLLSDQVAERRFILRCSKWFMPYSVNPYGVSLILGLHKAHCWNYLMIPFLLIRPFFQSRGYGSGFIFQFLILAMALLGTGIVLLLAHNHLCLSPSTTGSGFSGYAPELVYLLTSSVSQSLAVILRTWF